jgi:hypothetical protein
MTEEFAGWLRKGLGRAAVFLKSHDSRPYREALFYACTHNLVYDRQCEESRAPYLWDLIELSGDSHFYRDRILSALTGDDEEFDLCQLFELATNFAAKGDAEMKRAMYSAFEAHGFVKAGLVCAEQLVSLDGSNGLLFLTNNFGAVDAGDRPWQFGSLLEALEKRDGKQSLPANLDHFVREWQDQEQLWKRQRQKPPEPRPNYETVKRFLNREGVGWARSANGEELEMAASDLLAEKDRKQLLGYLRMFRFRTFPRAIDRLLELARDADDHIARAALVALRNVTDSRVRALGLELLAGLRWREFAVGLLTRNSQAGDYRLIENTLEEEIDSQIYHSLCFDVRHFVEVHRSGRRKLSALSF